jgi:hypothetical protein
MVFLLVVLLVTVTTAAASAQDKSPSQVYGERIEQARIEYRAAIAKQIREAKKVEVFLLRFDDLVERGLEDDPTGRFPIDPYNATTSVISKTALDSSQAKELLLALAEQIEKADQDYLSQCMCHRPIHGVCVYSANIELKGDLESLRALEEVAVYSGSFSWNCRNFGFTYPGSDQSTEWLTTTDKLKAIFNKLMPIPKEELERMEKTYPTEQGPQNQ